MEAKHLFVDEASPVPLYAQLCEQVLAAVGRGDVRRGEQLPSVRDVAAALALNPNTVNRAYAELERDGVVETRRGRGTFVATRGLAGARAATPRLAEIAGGFVARARALGYEGTQIVNAVQAQVKAAPTKRRRS